MAGAAYELFVRRSTVVPRVSLPTADGDDRQRVRSASRCGPDGAILDWLPLPEEPQLPRLPLSAPPKGLLGGPMLEQARVLGAAPAALRPYLASSYYGESGVDVELRLGDRTALRRRHAADARSGSAAAAVLADPSIEALDYVDLHAPRRPAVGGSGHTLPALP